MSVEMRQGLVVLVWLPSLNLGGGDFDGWRIHNSRAFLFHSGGLFLLWVVRCKAEKVNEKILRTLA